MDEKQIELLIEKKVSEAKLDVAEKRFNHLAWMAGAMLALFGVGLPLWTTNHASDKLDDSLNEMKKNLESSYRDSKQDLRANSELLTKEIVSIRSDIRAEMDTQSRNVTTASDRVDKEVHNMQAQFKELAGIQLRTPTLECRWEGLLLEGRTVKLSPVQNQAVFVIKNTGTAPARNARVLIFTNFGGKYYLLNEPGMIPRFSPGTSADPNYQEVYELYSGALDSKESVTIKIDIPSDIDGNILKPGKYHSLMQIFYEQPEPIVYNFTVIVTNAN